MLSRKQISTATGAARNKAMMIDTTPEGPTIYTIRTADIGDKLRSGIVQLCLAAHDEPDFENLFAYLPPDGLHVVAARDGEPIGHAVVSTRWLQPGTGRLLRTAYVDAVAVSPDHQGRGIGGAVMQHLATAIGDYEIACLETDRQGFYERLGWEEWRGPLGGRSEDGLVPTPEQEGIMVLRLSSTPALDLDEQLTVEANRHRIW